MSQNGDVAIGVTKRRRLTAVLLVVAAAGFVTTHVVNGATPPRKTAIALLLTRVAGTPLTFVVTAQSATCSHQGCFHLLRTVDNGASFTARHLPPISSASGSSLGNLSQLTFANAHDGYASLEVGDSFVWYATTNGARSWRRLSAGPGESIVRLDPTPGELYAIIAHCIRAFTCSNYHLAHSPLAGDRWTKEPVPGPLASGDFSLSASGTNVWINLQGREVPLLFTSHNQGRTFSQRSASSLVSVVACAVTPTSSSVLWAECPTGMLVSFFYSGDAGAKWRSISRYAFAGTGGGTFDPVSSSLAYLDFGPYSKGSKDLYRITNSGKTMRAVGNLACTSTNYLDFVDSTDALAICQMNGSTSSTSLVRTSNGGEVWTKVSVPQ